MTKSCYLQNGSVSRTIRYGTGDVTLDLIYDSAKIGGIEIKDQGFGYARALSVEFNAVSCDGLVVSLPSNSNDCDSSGKALMLECFLLLHTAMTKN